MQLAEQLGGWWLRYLVVMRGSVAGAVGEWNIPVQAASAARRGQVAPRRPGTSQQCRAQLCGSLRSIGVGAAESEASGAEHWAGGT